MIILSNHLTIVDLVSHYLTNYLIVHRPLPNRPKALIRRPHAVLANLSTGYPSVWGAFPCVTQPSAARLPSSPRSVRAEYLLPDLLFPVFSFYVPPKAGLCPLLPQNCPGAVSATWKYSMKPPGILILKGVDFVTIHESISELCKRFVKISCFTPPAIMV